MMTKPMLPCLLLLAAPAWAQPPTPVGLWKNVDDASGQPTALIRITSEGRELKGRIEKLFNQAAGAPVAVCSQCSGALKDQPIVGLTILSGMQPQGPQYGGGQILDPGNGQTYRCTLELVDDGRKLKVRGYLGMPLLGRTQVWLRED
jgi:uncharacterized protein (DUF2147 family)